MKYEGRAPSTADASTGQILRVLRDIVEVEGPVLGSRLHDAYVIASGGSRVGRQIASTLNKALAVAARQVMIVSDDPLHRPGVRTQTYRLPDQPQVIARTLGPRDLDQVPPLELLQLLLDSATAVGWDSTENLFREVLDRLGRSRLTTGVRATLGAVLALAEEASTDVPAVPSAPGASASVPEPKAPPVSPELEPEFHRAMVRVYQRAKDEAGYNPTYFLRMLSEFGGLRTARQLLAHSSISAGFTELWERNRLDLTVEALVLDDRFAQLFTEAELQVARDRLGDHGHA